MTLLAYLIYFVNSKDLTPFPPHRDHRDHRGVKSLIKNSLSTLQTRVKTGPWLSLAAR